MTSYAMKRLGGTEGQGLTMRQLIQLQAEGRAAVLRVNHDVDRTGRVTGVRLEPLAGAASDDVVEAAWQAARRRHPWIVGDDASEQLEAARAIALNQVAHLMTTADEALLLLTGIEHAAVRRLRDACTDLRAYMPALHGDLPRHDNDQPFVRRAG